jgi:spectinomycin phosphotransferase
VFDRLTRAFSAAMSLRADAGLAFVVAAVSAAGGQVQRRLQDRYSVVVHPICGRPPRRRGRRVRRGGGPAGGSWPAIEIHGARTAAPYAGDFVVPHLGELTMMMDQTAQPWDSGPYAKRARDLLSARAGDLEVLLAAYDGLVARVAARPDRMVITHGEPHAGNVIVTPGGLVTIDWDTALLAPPGRDLWDLARHDESLLHTYAAATGVDIDQDALWLYRLWYDLAEIGGYLSLFRATHRQTADTAESWKNLRHFLQPAERWPALYEPGAGRARATT